MKLRGAAWWWVLGNIAWFILVPSVIALCLAREIDAQYASGLRTSADGDSLSIPIGAFILLNAALLLAVNGIAGLVLLARRLSRSMQGARLKPNPFIEATSSSKPRLLAAAPHVER